MLNTSRGKLTEGQNVQLPRWSPVGLSRQLSLCVDVVCCCGVWSVVLAVLCLHEMMLIREDVVVMRDFSVSCPVS